MNCFKCGTVNVNGAKFCSVCGCSLDGNVNPGGTFSSNLNYPNGNGMPSNVGQINPTLNLGVSNFLKMFGSLFLKPVTTLEKNKELFSVFKNSFLGVLLVSFIATIGTLFTTMMNAVIVKSVSFLGKSSTSFEWGNLSDLNYIQIILKNFFLYFAVIFGIGLIFYLASLVVKKPGNFSKFLGISVISLSPILLSVSFLSPIGTQIFSYLGTLVALAGGVFSLLLLYEGMNQELNLQGNGKFYCNLVCFSMVASSFYYLYISIFLSSVTSNIQNVLDFLK